VIKGERTYSLFGKTFVKAKLALLLTMCCLPLAISAQTSSVISAGFRASSSSWRCTTNT